MDHRELRVGISNYIQFAQYIQVKVLEYVGEYLFYYIGDHGEKGDPGVPGVSFVHTARLSRI